MIQKQSALASSCCGATADRFNTRHHDRKCASQLFRSAEPVLHFQTAGFLTSLCPSHSLSPTPLFSTLSLSFSLCRLSLTFFFLSASVSHPSAHFYISFSFLCLSPSLFLSISLSPTLSSSLAFSLRLSACLLPLSPSFSLRLTLTPFSLSVSFFFTLSFPHSLCLPISPQSLVANKGQRILTRIALFPGPVCVRPRV